MPRYPKNNCCICGSDKLAILLGPESAQIECLNCGHKGPEKKKLTGAMKAWNQEK